MAIRKILRLKESLTKRVTLFRQSNGLYGVEALKLNCWVPYGAETYNESLSSAFAFFRSYTKNFIGE